MMNKAVMLSFIAVLLVFSGCAFMNKVAPSQLDEAGNTIPGTHDVVQPVKDVAHAIPYGDVVIGILLLAWNGAEKYKSYKLGKGLKSTIQAIEKAGEDPAIADSIAKLKILLSNAHDVANVQSEVKDILAKI